MDNFVFKELNEKCADGNGFKPNGYRVKVIEALMIGGRMPELIECLMERLLRMSAANRSDEYCVDCKEFMIKVTRKRKFRASRDDLLDS